MHRDELRIDEYLRGELPLEEAERIAALLEHSAAARDHADWLMRVENLAEQVRMEPPEELVRAMETRLLTLPAQLAGGQRPAAVEVPLASRRAERVLHMPAWRILSPPAVRVAATLLVGVLIGYGLWGTGTRRTLPGSDSAGGFTALPEAPAPAGGADLSADMGVSGTPPAALQELEARVASLERNIEAAYFARVEAAMLRFVLDSSEGSVGTVRQEDTRDLLTLTANLKAGHKTSDDDMRMARLLGQIESVLLEMDRLGRERDLAGSRHVASVIREQGLLTTLQRLKAGVEE